MGGFLALPVRRLMLAMLVGMNLLLVCPGHADGSRHLGTHLAFMDEIGVSNAADTGSPARPDNTRYPAAQARASASTQECVIHSGTGDPGEGASLATIAVELAGVAGARREGPLSSFSTNYVRGASRPRVSPPDPPPQPKINPL